MIRLRFEAGHAQVDPWFSSTSQAAISGIGYLGEEPFMLYADITGIVLVARQRTIREWRSAIWSGEEV